jgi:hypothetical protein
MLGRGAQPADGVVIGRVQGTARKGDDAKRGFSRTITEPGFQARGRIPEEYHGRRETGLAWSPLAVFEPASCRPFKVGRKDKEPAC